MTPELYHIFLKTVILFSRPVLKRIYLIVQETFFGIRDRIGSKKLSQIRVGFSDLRDQRLNHKFNCASPTCKCGIEDETPVHYFLCCPQNF